MEKTFSHRRLEIVEQKPRIAEVKDRWPALFTPNGVNDEFVRITTKPLVSKFLSQLDHFSEKLISIFKPKGGAKGLKIRRLLEQSEEEDIDVKRECILKSLMVYLNEDPKSVFKDYGIDEVDNAENDVETTMMAIFVFRRAQHGFADDVWIIVEGVKVISRAGSVIMAFILLFGLIYALDLSYPGNLQHTFEFIQKVIMHMDGHRLNSKIQQLKMKMFQ